jgi:type IX secretion system PorP/SprF family membrane protein
LKKLLIIYCFFSVKCLAQYQGDYVQYMFNGLLLNPAYAGSHNALNLTGLYRNQWLGIDGAPVLKSFSAHGPLKNRKVNLGLIVDQESRGFFTDSRIKGIYAYRMRLFRGHLSFGLSGGVDLKSTDYNKARTKEGNDPNFRQGLVRETFITGGAGAYYHSEKFYLGLSCPTLYQDRLNKYPTVVLNSGFLCDLTSTFKFKPSVLVRYLPNSPASVNVAGIFYYKEVLGFGAGYTMNSSVMALLDVKLNEQLHFGYGFDRPTGMLSGYTAGSHEIMLRYLFSYKIKAVSARYF